MFQQFKKEAKIKKIPIRSALNECYLLVTYRIFARLKEKEEGSKEF